MKEIGEYFELELNKSESYYPDAIALDFGRSALRYIIRAYKIKEIYIPYYTCYVVWKTALSEGAKVRFYHINRNLLPDENIPIGSFILYTNYFGLSFDNVCFMAKKHNQLIIDNAQSFFAPPIGLASFNSPRKFMGIPDGSYLFCDRRIDELFDTDTSSWERCTHLIKKIDLGTNNAYAEFQVHDNPPLTRTIKTMSNLTRKLLASVNYQFIKERRLINFSCLHEALRNINQLQLSQPGGNNVPMVYPLLVENAAILRRKLFDNQIYTAFFWGNYPPSYYEAYLRNNLIPIPLDQRYDCLDMEHIAELIINNH